MKRKPKSTPKSTKVKLPPANLMGSILDALGGINNHMTSLSERLFALEKINEEATTRYEPVCYDAGPQVSPKKSVDYREEVPDNEDTARVALALDGTFGDDPKRIAEVGTEWLATLIKKNIDYGSSVWEAPALADDLTPGDAILVRMTDKIKRLQQLRNNPKNVTSESYEDTVRDLGAYCLLWLARPK